jgi:hypothetical protein
MTVMMPVQVENCLAALAGSAQQMEWFSSSERKILTPFPYFCVQKA